MTFQDFLIKNNACDSNETDAMPWLRHKRLLDTPLRAWQMCERGDWMLWLLRKIGYYNDKRAGLLTCRVVRETPLGDGRTVWDLLTDERSRKAIETAEAYARGEVGYSELRFARAAAAYAAAGAAAGAVVAAAYHATRTAEAGAAAAAYHAARTAEAQRRQAEIVREVVSEEEFLQLCRQVGIDIPELEEVKE